ncbi:MAG: hypothetical protein EZS28_041307, partial [Streblomastix strix]
ETFVYEVDPIATIDRDVFIELWDYNSIGSNEKMGEVKLPIWTYVGSKKRENMGVVGVGKQYGKNVGIIDADFLYEISSQQQQQQQQQQIEYEKDFIQDEQNPTSNENEQIPLTEEVQPAVYDDEIINQGQQQIEQAPEIIEEEDSLGGFEQADYIKGSIDVVVIGVRDLNIGGIEGLTVYVKGQLGKLSGLTGIGQIMNGGVKYQQQFELDYNPRETKQRKIRISLFEGSQNIKIGESLVSFVEFQNRQRQKSYDLIGLTGTQQEGIKIGVIDLELIYTPVYARKRTKSNIEGVQSEKEQKEEGCGLDGFKKGKLYVTILGVSDLVSMDSNGKTDPYVIVKFGGVEQKTKKVKDTLNAEFNETFVYEVDPIATIDRDVFIELWDYNSIGSNEKMGEVKLPVLI